MSSKTDSTLFLPPFFFLVHPCLSLLYVWVAPYVWLCQWTIRWIEVCRWTSQVVLVAKNLPANIADIRDAGLTSGLGRSPGAGNGYPVQYSCLKNPIGRRTWRATVHRVVKTQTWLKQINMHTHIEKGEYIYISRFVHIKSYCHRQDRRDGAVLGSQHCQEEVSKRECLIYSFFFPKWAFGATGGGWGRITGWNKVDSRWIAWTSTPPAIN